MRARPVENLQLLKRSVWGEIEVLNPEESCFRGLRLRFGVQDWGLEVLGSGFVVFGVQSFRLLGFKGLGLSFKKKKHRKLRKQRGSPSLTLPSKLGSGVVP